MNMMSSLNYSAPVVSHPRCVRSSKASLTIKGAHQFIKVIHQPLTKLGLIIDLDQTKCVLTSCLVK